MSVWHVPYLGNRPPPPPHTDETCTFTSKWVCVQLPQCLYLAVCGLFSAIHSLCFSSHAHTYTINLDFYAAINTNHKASRLTKPSVPLFKVLAKAASVLWCGNIDCGKFFNCKCTGACKKKERINNTSMTNLQGDHATEKSSINCIINAHKWCMSALPFDVELN